MSGISIAARVWTTPKPDAESTRENEDRFWLSGFRPGDLLTQSLHAAIADGASGSLFSREWARELVRLFCGSPSLSDSALWQRAAENWEQSVAGRDLPWYMVTKRAEGAQAAFLGITCRPDGTWNAIAAGDCCLFQRRGSALRMIFPLTRSDDFSHSPALWATGASPSQNAAATCRVEGGWEAGDNLYLMTDALALWSLGEIEAKRDPWVWLDGITSNGDFRRRVTLLRENGRLRGDDTTLLHLRLMNSEKEIV